MNEFEADLEALQNAVRLFSQTMKRPQRWTKITEQAGVSIDRPAAMILQTLTLNYPARYRVQDLAAHLGIEAPSVTRKTQELEQAGLIRRLPDLADRRAIGLEPTAEGMDVARRIAMAQREYMGKALSGWSNSDRRQFLELFQRFSDSLARLEHSDQGTIKPPHA